MDAFNILLVVIIILVAVYISIVLKISIFDSLEDWFPSADNPSKQNGKQGYNDEKQGGSGACSVERQDMRGKPAHIPPDAHIVVDGMNMLYHIKQHREGNSGGFLDDIYFYSMINEIAGILSGTFPRNMIHLIFKNFPHHTTHPRDEFNLNMLDISRRYNNVLFHIAFDITIYPRDKALHYLHGRDDLLSIIVFNYNIGVAKARPGSAMPFLISLDTYRDEFKYADIPKFVERHYYRGKITAENTVFPHSVAPEFVQSVVNHPNLIQFEIIDGNKQQELPINGCLYPQKDGNYYCVNIFDISKRANDLEW